MIILSTDPPDLRRATVTADVMLKGCRVAVLGVHDNGRAVVRRENDSPMLVPAALVAQWPRWEAGE